MDYRIYVLDATGRITAPALVIECPDDREAMRRAKQYLDGAAIEGLARREALALACIVVFVDQASAQSNQPGGAVATATALVGKRSVRFNAVLKKMAEA